MLGKFAEKDSGDEGSNSLAAGSLFILEPVKILECTHLTVFIQISEQGIQ